MELLGDVGQMEAHIGLLGDSVNLDARNMHSLYRTYNRLGNRFGCTRWNSFVTWFKWVLVPVCLETVLISVEDRWTICVECITGLEIFLATPDRTPRWRWSNGSSFSVCLEIVLISTQDRCMVWNERTIGSKSFWAHSMQFHGDVGLVELVSVHLEIVLILAQDRCMVWDEHTICMEIILGTPIELIGDEGQMEACFGLFGYRANLDATYVHSLR
jgi:hypothetical protein